MWLFTKYGFYSAVCARTGDGSYGMPIDHDRIMLRARLRPHLEALCNRFPDLLGGCEIHESDSSDYRFRVFMDKPVWSQMAAALAQEIDYGNFKDEAKAHQGHAGESYVDALHEVWSVMYELQRSEEL